MKPIESCAPVKLKKANKTKHIPKELWQDSSLFHVIIIDYVYIELDSTWKTF